MRSKYSGLIEPRLRLFLRHYQPQAGTETPHFSGDIDVRVCEDLSVTKTLFPGNKDITKTRSVWATAENELGKIKVWISGRARQDMYE